MSHRIVHETSAAYARALLDRHDEPVLVEMEAYAKAEGFPIVDRHVGVTLELLARAIGTTRVCELGSGFGYSAYWWARAGAEVHCTDGSPENAKRAEDYLTRAGLWDHLVWHTGDAVTELGKLDGEFDVVYNDIDKHGYPDAWRAARQHVRVGGLYVCDNVLWSGRAAEESHPDDKRPEWTAAIKEHNRLIADDDAWLSSILPIRDGVIVALRLS